MAMDAGMAKANLKNSAISAMGHLPSVAPPIIRTR